MACQRGVTSHATASLDQIVALTLSRRMIKSSSVRLSKWSSSTLSVEQQKYAALDVTEGLRVYLHLAAMPDLSQRLPCDDAVVGTEVDIVPKRGSICQKASRAAAACIVDHTQSWTSPLGTRAMPRPKTQPWRLVQVSSVRAPALIIPGFKVHATSPIRNRIL